jgi:predicted metalloendopeptidase
MPIAGGFAELRDNVEKILMDDFKLLEKADNIDDANLKKAVDLYAIAKNVKKRNSQGIKPLLKDLKAITDVNDINLFNRKLKNFVINGYPLPFSFYVDTDLKDSNKHALMLQGPRTFLPDTTFYNPNNPRKDMLLNMWKTFAAQALSFAPLSPEDQALYLNDAIEFDAIIASLVKSREEWSEYTKMYNPYKVNKVNKLLMSATDSEDLRHIFQVVKIAESRPVNLDRLNIQELRLYCNAFDYKYNECLTNSFDMWSEVFGTEFNDRVRKEIVAYIENCD